MGSAANQPGREHDVWNRRSFYGCLCCENTQDIEFVLIRLPCCEVVLCYQVGGVGVVPAKSVCGYGGELAPLMDGCADADYTLNLSYGYYAAKFALGSIT